MFYFQYSLLSTNRPDTADGRTNKKIEILDIIQKSVWWRPGWRVMKTRNFGTVGCGLSCEPPMLSSTLGMRSHISLPWKLDQKQKKCWPHNFGNTELFQDLDHRGTRWRLAGRLLGKALLELVRCRLRWRGLEPASRGGRQRRIGGTFLIARWVLWWWGRNYAISINYIHTSTRHGVWMACKIEGNIW